jgi:hypothetical protein
MLVTVEPEGYPQVTALWFRPDADGAVKLSLNTARQKVKHHRERPECTLFGLDRANSPCTIVILGSVSLYVVHQSHIPACVVRPPHQK